MTKKHGASGKLFVDLISPLDGRPCQSLYSVAFETGISNGAVGAAGGGRKRESSESGTVAAYIAFFRR